MVPSLFGQNPDEEPLTQVPTTPGMGPPHQQQDQQALSGLWDKTHTAT